MPNLVRDEWVNIGVLLFDPAQRPRPAPPDRGARGVRPRAPPASRRRRGAAAAAARRIRGAARRQRPARRPASARLEQTLSNAVQLSPQKGLLAEDLDAELDRLYRDHVEPPRYGRAVRRSRDAQRHPHPRQSGVPQRGHLAAPGAPRARRGVHLSPAIPCAWTTPTGATARAGSCRLCRSGAIPDKPRCWPSPPTPSAPSCRKTEFLAVTEVEPRPRGKCAAPFRHRPARRTRNPRGAADPPGGMGAALAALAARRGQRHSNHELAREFQAYRISSSQVSRCRFTCPMNWCAMAPSTMRWS